MGNILSNDEKFSSHQRRELFASKNKRFHHSNRLPHRSQYYKYKQKKGDFLRSKNDNDQNLRIRSQSLNAIIDDFYWFEADDIIENQLSEIKFDANKPLIPRIKLRKVPTLKEEGRYKKLLQMSSEPELYSATDSANSSSNFQLKDQNDNDQKLLNRLSILISEQNYEEIPSKPEDNYFSRNFDKSIKELEKIEKEHELIENENSDIQIFLCEKNADKRKQAENDSDFINKNCNGKIELKNYENSLDSGKQERVALKSKNQNESFENGGEINFPKKLSDNITIADPDATNGEGQENEKISEWYSNLKERFEKPEQENERPVQEMSCRITGAILKNTSECSKPEEKEKDTRHYFSKLVKSNKSLIDEELPDPDKVKNIRAMFQESLNSTLKKRLDKKLGGSLQNINIRASEQHMTRPLSAQCYRNDDARDDQKFNNISATDISGTVKDDGKEYMVDRKRIFEKYEKDSKLGKELRSRKFLQPKWTDTGSLSSGVSSDLSSYDTDLESFSREGPEQDEIVVSDDDLLDEVNDKHYVQNEVLERIRSFGTSVTYYGGEMISCSVGPLLSPTTQAIMEEISEKYGHEPTGTRSFEEFYRKYVETNEPNRKKKLGRARSFGQSDVFQKPNVLSNSEIDMFKNDLEIEIGIKKPSGISQNSLKRKAVKSASLDSPVRNEEKETSSESVPKSESSSVEDKTSTTPQIPVADEKANGTQLEVLPKEETVADGSDMKLGKNDNKEADGIKESKRENSYMRAQSVPEGTFKSEMYEQCETSRYKPTEEILFGYEKSLLNGKAKPDMEFEEFEVCEAASEKLQKLEEKNSQFREITEANGSAEGENRGESISPDENQRESFSNFDGKGERDEISGVKFNKQISLPDEKFKSDKFTKYNYSKWPIETTVMVDIQKNTEQTPKIVKTEKTVAKTKLRLF